MLTQQATQQAQGNIQDITDCPGGGWGGLANFLKLFETYFQNICKQLIDLRLIPLKPVLSTPKNTRVS